MSKKEANKYVAVGGQALMEGIMMKGPKGTAMSLRLPDKSIETQMKEQVSLRKKYKFFNIPILRGIVSFVESLVSGYKYLMESAEKTGLDLDSTENESKLDRWITEHFGKKMMTVIGVISGVLGVGLALLLFMYLPSLAFDLLNDYVADGKLDFLRAVFEGLIRIVIFVAYMAIVARMKEIRRVYMYHGAEHKTIFCFESGEELTVENVRKQSRFHPRCGTSFIFVTILLSILISSVVAVVFPEVTQTRLIWVAVKLLMMPVIMGIGFEFIQLAGKYPNKFTRLLSMPGLLMQRITTAEPTPDMIEVAIAAMKAALTGEVEMQEKTEETAAAAEESVDGETAENTDEN